MHSESSYPPLGQSQATHNIGRTGGFIPKDMEDSGEAEEPWPRRGAALCGCGLPTPVCWGEFAAYLSSRTEKLSAPREGDGMLLLWLQASSAISSGLEALPSAAFRPPTVCATVKEGRLRKTCRKAKAVVDWLLSTVRGCRPIAAHYGGDGTAILGVGWQQTGAGIHPASVPSLIPPSRVTLTLDL